MVDMIASSLCRWCSRIKNLGICSGHLQTLVHIVTTSPALFHLRPDNSPWTLSKLTSALGSCLTSLTHQAALYFESCLLDRWENRAEPSIAAGRTENTAPRAPILVPSSAGAGHLFLPFAQPSSLITRHFDVLIVLRLVRLFAPVSSYLMIPIRQRRSSVFLLGPNGEASLSPGAATHGDGYGDSQFPMGIPSPIAIASDARYATVAPDQAPTPSTATPPFLSPPVLGPPTPSVQATPPIQSVARIVQSQSLLANQSPSSGPTFTNLPKPITTLIQSIAPVTVVSIIGSPTLTPSSPPALALAPTPTSRAQATSSNAPTPTTRAVSVTSSPIPSDAPEPAGSSMLNSPPIIIAIVIAGIIGLASIAAFISWMLRMKRKNNGECGIFTCLARKREDPIEKWDYNDLMDNGTPGIGVADTNRTDGIEDRVQRLPSQTWSARGGGSEVGGIFSHRNSISYPATPYPRTAPLTLPTLAYNSNLASSPQILAHQPINSANLTFSTPSGAMAEAPYSVPRRLSIRQEEPFPTLPMPCFSQQQQHHNTSPHSPSAFGHLTITNLAPGDISETSRANSKVGVLNPAYDSPWHTPQQGHQGERVSSPLPAEFGTPREVFAGGTPRFMGLQGQGLPLPWAPLNVRKTNSFKSGPSESIAEMNRRNIAANAPRLPTPVSIISSSGTSTRGSSGGESGWAASLRSNLLAAIGGAMSTLSASQQGEEDRRTLPPRRISSRRLKRTSSIDLESATADEPKRGGPSPTRLKASSPTSCSRTSSGSSSGGSQGQRSSKRRIRNAAHKLEPVYEVSPHPTPMNTNRNQGEVERIPSPLMSIPSSSAVSEKSISEWDDSVDSATDSAGRAIRRSRTRTTVGSASPLIQRKGGKRLFRKASIMGGSALAPAQSASANSGKSRLYLTVQRQRMQHSDRISRYSPTRRGPTTSVGSSLAPSRSSSVYSTSTGGWTTDRSVGDVRRGHMGKPENLGVSTRPRKFMLGGRTGSESEMGASSDSSN